MTNSSFIPSPPSGFVIVDKQTGLYSSGGSYPKFKKTPKIWNKKNHVKAHLSMFVGLKYNIHFAGGSYISPVFSNSQGKVEYVLDIWKPYNEIGRYFILEITSGEMEDVCEYFSNKLHKEYNKIKNHPHDISDIAKAIMGAFPQ